MPPVVPPPAIPSLVSVIPPASATVLWAIPTKFDVIRCLAWEEEDSRWRLAVVFGNDLLKTELVPDLNTLLGVADLLQRALAPRPLVGYRPERADTN